MSLATFTTEEAQASKKNGSHTSRPSTNVGSIERLVTALSGGWLVFRGLKKGDLTGLSEAGVGGALLYRATTGRCGLYQKLGISTVAGKGTAPSDYEERGIHVSKAMTINKPAGELFDYWRNFENLPRIMSHLQNVKVLDNKRSHWKVKGPAGFSVEWDAEIINENPGSLIAWRSVDGAAVASAGSVRFIDTGDRGTEVRIVLNYLPPAGRVAKWIAALFGEEPGHQVKEDLRHFKQAMEAGEIPTTQSQPRGRGKK